MMKILMSIHFASFQIAKIAHEVGIGLAPMLEKNKP